MDVAVEQALIQGVEGVEGSWGTTKRQVTNRVKNETWQMA